MKKTQTLLITGCSTGIGYHTAKTLSQLGHQVITTCRQTKDVARLQSDGLYCVQMDLAESASIQQALVGILAEFEQIDVLFNNAAFGLPGAVEDLSRTALEHQFATNVFGTQELTNQILTVMRRQVAGKIIYNSSILGFAAMPYRGAYNASKFAIEGLADTLRLELKSTPIHVSLIEPGPIRSQFRANAYQQFQQWITPENSAHQQQYQAMIQRLETEGDAAPFTLGPEAVTEVVQQILAATKPKARYRVTLPTKVFALLKRLLPTVWLDQLLMKAGGNGKR